MEIKTLVADPPWQFDDKLSGKSRGAEKNYSVLSLDEICAFLKTHRVRLADDARLFLWRVASMQEEALKVMRAWGFTPKSEIIWIKKTVGNKRWFGMGRTVRMEHEVCLIGTRGRPPVLNHGIRSCFEAKYTRHSGKPEEFFDIVTKLSPGPYAELFARVARPKWLQIGNELPVERNENGK